MKKTLLCLMAAVAVVAMLVICCPAMISSAAGNTYDYTIENGILYISGNGDVGDFSADNMAPWYESRSLITDVAISDGITSLGNMAFYNFTALKNITIPESTVEIGASCFYRCRSLNRISLPQTLGSIGSYAFEGSGLAEINMPDGVTEIPDGCFSGCTSLANVRVSENLTSIGKYAFENCSSLTNISYGGTRELYGAVNIGIGNESFISAAVEYHYGNHSFDRVAEVVEANCSHGGYKLLACSCGETKKTEETEQLEHLYKDYPVGNGEIFSRCELCGDVTYRKNEGEANSEYNIDFIIGKTVISSKTAENNIPVSPLCHGDIFNLEDGTGVRFTSWDKELSPANGDCVYTAVYERLTGWQSNCSGTRYYDENGNFLRGFAEVDGKTYYFYKATGYMVKTASCVIGGIPYDFNEDHTVKPLNGIKTVGGRKYYYIDGVMQTGWQMIDGNRYYFCKADDKYGVMATMYMSIEDRLYYFYSATGILFDKSGTIGGVWYDVSPEGYLYIEGLFTDSDGNTRYYNEDNIFVRATWVDIGDKKYYFLSANGYAVKGEIKIIGGILYEFDENGVCLGAVE